MAPIGTRRVLVVEDDPAVAEVMGAIMRIVADEIVIAGSLRGCMECVATKTFSLVLLDLMLPDSRAYNTIAAIPAIKAAGVPRVVCVTASDVGYSLLAEAREAGAEDILSKNNGLHRKLTALFD